MIKAYRAKTVIAEYLGYDSAEMEDYRYHYGMTNKPVYAIGDNYYCAGKIGQKPASYQGDKEHWDWEPVNDKFIESIGWQVWKA